MVLAAFALDASLPPASWSVARDGSLSGTVHTEACFEAYLAVVGAEHLMPLSFGQQLFTTFRGVTLSLAGMYEGAAAQLGRAA